MWKIDTCKMWSLGFFTEPPPISFDVFARAPWEDSFHRWLEERLTGKFHTQVRNPQHSASLYRALTDDVRDYDYSADDWHNDGMLAGTTHLGLWSNSVGTLIRPRGYKGKFFYQAEPGEVILFDNRFFVHKPPYDFVTVDEARDRWFMRFHVGDTVRDHPDVRQLTGRVGKYSW